jgi:antitoxin ParD1/3/4
MAHRLGVATGTVRKTITLTDQQDDWIKSQIEGDCYTNDSKYIRDLTRRDQERGAEIEVVRATLIDGEKSGKSKCFDANAIKRKLCGSWGKFADSGSAKLDIGVTSCSARGRSSANWKCTG